MPSNVVMPKTGADATEAKLIRWLKKEGDPVSRGEAVAEIETDKVNMEVEAFNPGILYRILAPEGTTLAIGTPIAIVLKEGEAPPSDLPAAPAATSAPAAPAPAAPPAPPVAAAPPDQPVTQTPGPAQPAPARPAATASAPAPAPAPALAATGNGHAEVTIDGRIKASPLARRMAQEHNLDLAQIRGRGPGGRVVKEDVEEAIRVAPAAPVPIAFPTQAASAAAPAPAAAPQPAAATASVPSPAAEPLPEGARVKDLTRIQLTTGRRLAESKQQAPHFYLTVEVDMAEALRLRATLNEQAAGSVRISVNDLVIKAATWALGRHPNLNASFRDGKLIVFDHVNISVAVAIDDGLVSPVLPDCDRKSLGQIARESQAMVERARTGKLRPEDLSGGTFTISNLGTPAYDIDTFVAIINPPQAAILAVGAVRQVPVVRDGEIVIGQVMKATLSCDHRAADGAQGAQFLTDVRRALESPLLMAL